MTLLEERGVDIEVIDYLESPPSVEQLAMLLGKLGMSARGITRFGESRAAELGIGKDDARSEQDWIALLAANPILIERPIVDMGEHAVIGRPPENILRLLGSLRS